MLAKAIGHLPEGEGFIFEPKWDGFRCVVFRDGDSVELGSRNDRPLTRYFPELLDPLRAMLPDRCVLDGELVIATPGGLDFDALGQRIHPAASRVHRLAAETPASFVAFDLVALDDLDARPVAFVERRRLLEAVLADSDPPIYLTPATTDRSLAAEWFVRFEGAGFDGVVAKPGADPYVPDKRVIWKVKHQRTAEMVVAGYRRHKDGLGVGSLLLGIFDGEGRLHNVGVATSFTAARRVELLDELAPFEHNALVDHPWHEWASAAAHEESDTRMPGAPSRWNSTKDLSWVPLRCELVAEVGYQGMSGNRLRHPAKFVRWRRDRVPGDCRFDQLEQVAPAELAQVFAL